MNPVVELDDEKLRSTSKGLKITIKIIFHADCRWCMVCRCRNSIPGNISPSSNLTSSNDPYHCCRENDFGESISCSAAFLRRDLFRLAILSLLRTQGNPKVKAFCMKILHFYDCFAFQFYNSRWVGTVSVERMQWLKYPEE